MYYLTNKYCCTCLSTESTKLIDLTNLDSDTISFYEKLAVCVPNRISLEMKIQENFLCDDCSQNISQFYDFYNICMKSKTILDNVGLKVQYFKVGDQNTVVNIIPNDYYLFNNTNDITNKINETENIPTEKIGDNILSIEQELNKNDIELIETDTNVDKIKNITKKRKTYKTTSELVNSILKEKIIQDSSYTCNICQKKFNKKGLLIIHITLEHSSKKFYCEICDKQCNDNNEYKIHMELHEQNFDKKEDKKQYTCNYCKKIFTSNSALCRHKKIHTNDRRYACDLCSVRYIQKAQIINHITKYHPGYVYEEKKCKTCRKVFETKNDLEIHNKINHELKFDLKTLEILQTSNGNIRNIIECVNNTRNVDDINSADDIIYVNTTESDNMICSDINNSTDNIIYADDTSNVDNICDNNIIENFNTNCDSIEYNNDIIESIGSVNIIDLDNIENDSIIEEHIEEINETLTGNFNKTITKSEKIMKHMKEEIIENVNDDLILQYNLDDQIINNDVVMDGFSKNDDNIQEIEDNNIDVRKSVENNKIGINRNIDDNISINESIDNSSMNKNVDNNMSQDIILSLNQKCSADLIDVNIFENKILNETVVTDKNHFKNIKMYNKEFRYKFNRFNRTKKMYRKNRLKTNENNSNIRVNY